MTECPFKTVFNFAARIAAFAAAVVSAIALMASPFGGVSAEMIQSAESLPKTVGVWTRSDSVRMVDSGNIFEYMNGAGELYLAYGFDHLEVHEYTAQQQESILVELYVMNTSDDAFGLLSLDWGGEPVSVYAASRHPSHPAVAPSTRALYGGGLLRIWADTVYARVMAYRETAESRQAVLSLGKSIAENRRMPAEPELLKVFPDAVGSDWTIRKDRIAFFRSHLVFNSLYYLSHQNILNLDPATEAATAPYENASHAGTPERVQVLFVKYPDPKRAKKAVEKFHDAYLPEHPREFDRGIAREHRYAFKIEDGWLGYGLHGKDLVIVFECPNRESARMIVEQISLPNPNKENSHEK